MSDLRRTGFCAVVLLVALRLAIGWQLLYEGLWKYQTLSTATPWSARGYLANAQGPLREVFRWMSGDPDDLAWLDEQQVAQRWDTWKERFIAHYNLTDRQASQLNTMIDGARIYVAELKQLPEEVDFAAARVDGLISWNPEEQRLEINGEKHLTPSERQRLEQQVAGLSGPEYDAYREALGKAFTRNSRLAYKERLRAHLLGDPENAGLIDGRISELDLYRQLVDRYRNRLASAEVPFEYEHLDRIASETRSRGQDLAGPVKALDAELKDEATELLTVEQLQQGPLPTPWSPLKVVDLLTVSGLIVLGALLILGLFTRFAAVAAAMMVLGFYLAMPPLPGVPEVPGPEHSFIINKNLVEVLALFALAALPTGKWFGVDAALRRVRRRPAAA